MMVVEFLGLPGAGKSTLCRALAPHARGSGLAIEDAMEAFSRQGLVGRTAIKIAVIARSCLSEPRRFFQRFRRILQLRPGLSPRSWAAVVNWLFVSALASGHRTPRIRLLDQGLLQGLVSIAFRWKGGVPDDYLRSLLLAEMAAFTGARYVVVVVRAADHTAMGRLASRPDGGSPLDEATQPDWPAAIDGVGRVERILAAATAVDARFTSVEIRTDGPDGSLDRTVPALARRLAEVHAALDAQPKSSAG